MCHSRMLTIQGPTCGQCKVPEGDNAAEDEEHPCGWHQRFQISWTVDRRIKVQELQRTGSWRRVARCVDVADAGQQSEEAECRGAADVEDTDDGTIDNAEVVKRVPNKMVDPRKIKYRRSAWSRAHPPGVSQARVDAVYDEEEERWRSERWLESTARKRETWICILRR